MIAWNSTATGALSLNLRQRNSEWLEQLIARLQARIQKFDAATVGASSASPVQNSPKITIQPETSSSVAESQNRIRIPNADQASLAPFPAGPEYHMAPKTKRGPKPKIRILVTTDGVSSPPGEAPAPRRYKTSCKYEHFRQFAFDLGKRHLRNGRLGQITMKSIIEAYHTIRYDHKVGFVRFRCSYGYTGMDWG